MERKVKAMLYAVGILTALNFVLTGLQFLPAARAEVAGMDHSDLSRDRDFRRAVEGIVEDCQVSVDTDTGSISC